MLQPNKIKIIGAGMVGLALANKLAQTGFVVELVEHAHPNLDFEPGVSRRFSALSLASRDLLKSLGVWQAIRRPCVEPFSKIHAWTQSTNGQLNFDAADIGKRYLAYVVENREIVRVLWERAAQDKRIDILDECKNRMSLDAAPLVVGADGAHSQVRRDAQINFKERSYGQHAIVATVHSHKPHHNSAYQNFLRTGPLGVLPLPHPHHVSIVWSAEDDTAQALMEMNEAKFNNALTNALDVRLGKLTVQGERTLFPLMMRHADVYVKSGIALVGDAAHTVHPLAGQGVNLGFQDVAILADCLEKASQKKRALGDLSVLRQYERIRRIENGNMLTAMQLFRNHGHQLGLGFGLLDRIAFMKNKFMALA